MASHSAFGELYSLAGQLTMQIGSGQISRSGSSRFPPDNMSDLWICRQNLLQRLRETAELRCHVNLPEQLSNDGGARPDETQKLVFISRLVSATKAQFKSFVANRHVPSPILRNHLIRRNTSLP